MSQRFKHPACSFTIFVLVCSVCSIFTFSGCGTAKTETQSDAKDTESASVDDSNMNSVAATHTSNVTSPAVESNALPGPEATPEFVCDRFMKLLQSGNRTGAENLFTRTALTTTTKAGLKLEPMGGPTSTYRVADARYATSRKKLAQVDCFISDTDENGETYEMEVTWQLHKLSTGFRISGVMLQLGEGSAKDLLSLENSFDVARLQSLAGADVLNETETRQAKAVESTLK